MRVVSVHGADHRGNGELERFDPDHPSYSHSQAPQAAAAAEDEGQSIVTTAVPFRSSSRMGGSPCVQRVIPADASDLLYSF